ncbi:beta-lactamase family protein [Hypoxylon rubiginosum]|uniref:Beta-lactamase family protein n=1 Tax=Hypoxylon rubiginosum TaxID=110542 RepID=A0ACB9Z022_9PEZI|nr:beta-lactamase family protein [Hypoxylon rubiginosum]
MPFSQEAVTELRSIMEQSIAATGDEAVASTIPGATLVVVGRDGTELFAHAAGKRNIRSQEPMTLENVMWMASCTKMVVGLACMQLVERGALQLDDAAQVEELCPELRDVKVLRDDGTFEDRKKGITLRMLLTHTSGFGNTFFEETLRDWGLPIGIDEFSGDIRDILKIPLRFQPGEGWMYGIGIDWAGIILHRKTGLSLNDFIQENICRPLGLENINFLPTQAMKDNLATMHARQADGKLVPRDHLQRRPLVVETPEEIAGVFHSGGAGLFAKPQEYARILAVLLNDGACPRTGSRLLAKTTVDAMFANQIPRFPDFGRQGIPAAKPDLTNPLPDLYPVAGAPPQGWGLTFMLSGANPATGRSDGTAYWAGLANTYWWCDRERGVAGLVCAQILPFLDAGVVDLWWKLEAAVFRHV